VIFRPITWRGRPALTIAGVLYALLAFAQSHAQSTHETFQGRALIVHAPGALPDPAKRALIIVLHGGLGNADLVESKFAEGPMNLNASADQNGFVVAYLNGTRASPFVASERLAWNAGGGCCGAPFRDNVDDVGYIADAVHMLASRYGVPGNRVFAIGHSNGAMMAQRLICESHAVAAIVAIAGPLNIQPQDCPGARGKRILAIHGLDDENVPFAGGHGTKGLAQVNYASEVQSQQIMERSGATYELDGLAGADHPLDHIDAAVRRAEGQSIAEKALRFFGLIAAKS
jgi:poly(3-hydroxybutyrate) depolymerase